MQSATAFISEIYQWTAPQTYLCLHLSPHYQSFICWSRKHAGGDGIRPPQPSSCWCVLTVYVDGSSVIVSIRWCVGLLVEVVGSEGAPLMMFCNHNAATASAILGWTGKIVANNLRRCIPMCMLYAAARCWILGVGGVDVAIFRWSNECWWLLAAKFELTATYLSINSTKPIWGKKTLFVKKPF